MKAKSFLRIAAIVMMMAFTLPASSALVIPSTEPVAKPATEDPRTQQLVNRLETIRSMDMSTLSKSERKKLKKEVKSIKKEMKKPISGGVYLSVGAIIIIILLLILLL